MTGKLTVEPEQLKNTANSFNDTGSQIQALTNKMMENITGMAGQWTGEAAKAYINKFTGLQDDINRMIGMIKEHVTDLHEMASEYESAESKNQELAKSLIHDVIS